MCTPCILWRKICLNIEMFHFVIVIRAPASAWLFSLCSASVKRLMSCQARGERLCAVARAGCSQTRTRVSDFHPQTLTLLPVPMLTKSRSRRMVSQTTEPVWDHRRYIDSEKNEYRTDLTVSHKGLLCARSGFHLRYFLTSRPHHPPPPLALRLMLIIWCSFLPVKRAHWLFSVLCAILGLSAPGTRCGMKVWQIR